MLHHLKNLQGYALRASDGDIGTVKDFYFDDERWAVRYLVVETGTWLASRKVLISPVSLGTPNDADRVLPVSITREQVRMSPDIDTDKPVSRQHEADYLDYYGYPAYWDGVGLWGAGAVPGMMLPEVDVVPPPLGSIERKAIQAEQRALHANDDPHLRSCKATTGYHIKAQDQEIGHVQGWIVDDESWALRYLVVDTSNWWTGKSVLIAPAWIRDVSWAEALVSVDLTSQAIKASPPFEPDQLPTRAQEAGMYAHYDRSGYW